MWWHWHETFLVHIHTSAGESSVPHTDTHTDHTRLETSRFLSVCRTQRKPHQKVGRSEKAKVSTVSRQDWTVKWERENRKRVGELLSLISLLPSLPFLSFCLTFSPIFWPWECSLYRCSEVNEWMTLFLHRPNYSNKQWLPAAAAAATEASGGTQC